VAEEREQLFPDDAWDNLDPDDSEQVTRMSEEKFKAFVEWLERPPRRIPALTKLFRRQPLKRS